MNITVQWMTHAEIDSAEMLPVWPAIVSEGAAAKSWLDDATDDVECIALSDDEAFDAFFGVR